MATIKVDITGSDKFKNMAEIIKDFLEDEDIPKNIRKKYSKEVENKVLGN